MTVPPVDGGDVSRETWVPSVDTDTPIGAAAELAMKVLHTAAGQACPARRRTFTVANQKGGVAGIVQKGNGGHVLTRREGCFWADRFRRSERLFRTVQLTFQ